MFATLFDTRIGTLIYLSLRVLAVLDAMLIPAVVIWWFYERPNHGGMAGAVAAVFMAWWALKRGSRAVLAFEEYSWVVVKIATILAIIVGTHLVMKHWALVGQLFT